MPVCHADSAQLFKDDTPHSMASHRGCHRPGDNLIDSKHGSQGRFIVHAVGETKDRRHLRREGFNSLKGRGSVKGFKGINGSIERALADGFRERLGDYKLVRRNCKGQILDGLFNSSRKPASMQFFCHPRLLQEYHMVPGQGQTAAGISANRTRAEYQDV